MNLNVVYYCAEEVRRQGRGPIQVANMVEAWEYANKNVSWMFEIEPEKAVMCCHASPLQHIGRLIEPEKNPDSRWRGVNVYVGMRVCPRVDELDELMHWWAENYLFNPEAPAEKVYYEFEMIHPLVDGNGRMGKILYNLKRNTMENPEFPPDFFGGIANP